MQSISDMHSTLDVRNVKHLYFNGLHNLVKLIDLQLLAPEMRVPQICLTYFEVWRIFGVFQI
jgi:hypothetical protein